MKFRPFIVFTLQVQITAEGVSISGFVLRFPVGLRVGDFLGRLFDFIDAVGFHPVKFVLRQGDFISKGGPLAADAVKLDKATTVNGGDADINVAGTTVTIDGATITATDVAASNGVIHVIDTVMLPD